MFLITGSFTASLFMAAAPYFVNLARSKMIMPPNYVFFVANASLVLQLSLLGIAWGLAKLFPTVFSLVKVNPYNELSNGDPDFEMQEVLTAKGAESSHDG